MAKLILLFTLLSNSFVFAQTNATDGPYEDLIQASRLVVGFLDNGLTVEEVFAQGNACDHINMDDNPVERVRCEEILIRQAEAQQARAVVNQLPVDDCRGPIMVAASASAYTRSQYNRGDVAIQSRSVQRARALYRVLLNHCPNRGLGFANVLPYINGEDLYTQAEIVEGVACNENTMLRLGYIFRHRQAQTQAEHAQVHRLTYFDQEVQVRMFNERNQRLTLIRSAIENKCRMALERNSELEERYREGLAESEL